MVFLSSHYQRKDWCGVEFRAIQEIIKVRDNKRIMFVRTDDGRVDGVFDIDGYIDGREYEPEEISAFIRERVELLR